MLFKSNKLELNKNNGIKTLKVNIDSLLDFILKKTS